MVKLFLVFYVRRRRAPRWTDRTDLKYPESSFSRLKRADHNAPHSGQCIAQAPAVARGGGLSALRLTRRGSTSASRNALVPPAVYASTLAWQKAREVARRRQSGLVLAADTVCAVGSEILNKPRDRADAERMIRLQEGHDTDVISGICLYRADMEEWVGAVEVSVVRFRPLSDLERARFTSTRAGGKGSRAGTACKTATHLLMW